MGHPPGPLVVALDLGLHPGSAGSGARGSGRVVCRVAVLGLGSGPGSEAAVGDPVVLADADGRVPARGWELRSNGLWADQVCEEPGKRWSYGLEAFALAVDDPAELLGAGRGHRVPLGWELEFDATAEPAGLEPGSGLADGGYRQRGRVEGVVLVGHQRYEVDGEGVRLRHWGPPPVPDLSLDHPSGLVDWEPVALPGPFDVWWVAVTPDGVESTSSPLPRDRYRQHRWE